MELIRTCKQIRKYRANDCQHGKMDSKLCARFLRGKFFFFLHFANLVSWYNFDRWPTWGTIVLYNTFISILYMFRANTCSSSGGQFINTASGIVTLCKWPSGMHVEQELLDLLTGRPLTESDYTRCCINTIDLLMMSTCLLETQRGSK